VELGFRFILGKSVPAKHKQRREDHEGRQLLNQAGK
jgi:hypothetical protein